MISRGTVISALAVFFAVLMIASPAAAANPGLNFSSDKAPNPTAEQSELVIAEHNVDEMSGPLSYYGDDGEVQTLDATYNDSMTTPLGVRFDLVDADVYTQFPRVSGEVDNNANWTMASDWTTSASAGSMSVSDADTEGVERLQFSTSSVTSGNTATAALASDVSITEDANKRVLTWVGSVDSLDSGATVEVRAVDSDGDYRYATVDTSATGSDADIIATGTGTSLVFQERLANLPLAGSGDGSFDSIESVEVVSVDGDSTVTTTGLDLDRKGAFDVAEIERDTDGDGELETTTVQNIWTGGKTNITSLDSLGTEFDEARIIDLSVYEVDFSLSTLTDEDEYSVNVTSADAYSYPQKLELYSDIEVPTAIDLSHGALSLTFEQGLISERYVTLEVATNVDSSTDFGNVSDSSYTDKTGALAGVDEKATLVSSVSSGETNRVHAVILLQDEDVDEILDSGMMGPTGSSSSGFFSTLWGKIVGIGGTVLGVVGLGRYFGGGS